tara:strand:- start:45 stop:881 length:837 start_codon:yes stop_codon:yes gene_type:complete
MKKVITTFFALALIVSVTSCGETTEKKSKKSKKERLEDRAEDDAKTMAGIYDPREAMNDAREDDGTKQIASYEAVALDLQKRIDLREYYSENEDAFDALVEAMEEEDEDMAEDMGDYKDWKKIAKQTQEFMIKDLEYWNQELEEIKEEMKEEMKEEYDFSSALFGGRSAEDDAKMMADGVADLREEMVYAKEARGKKQIAAFEAVALDIQSYIDMVEYYIEDEDAFDALVEALEEEDEDMAERMDDYKDWKKNAKKFMKNFKKSLKDWNKELEEMKED